MILLISILTFCIYIGAVIAKYGIPASISETFYLLPKKLNWLFTVFCWIVSIIIVPWLNISPDVWQFLAFLAVGGLCFVGTAAQFKEDFVKKVHFGAAGVCMAASQAWILLSTNLWWVSLVCLIISAILCFLFGLKNKKNLPKYKVVFWAEIWAFVSLFIVLILMTYAL